MINRQDDLTTTLAEVRPTNLKGQQWAERALASSEARHYGAAYEVIQARSAVELGFQFDKQHDRYLGAALDAIDDGLRRLPLDRQAQLFLRGVRKLIVLAQEADAREDGEITAADGRMAAAHEEAKAGAGAIEMLLVGRSRD